MATSKANAVQNNEPPVYCIYDSAVPNTGDRNDVLTRSIAKARTKFIGVALNDVKGLQFSDTRLRILYCEQGFHGNPSDTVKLEFTAVYGTGLGKVKDNMVSLARQPEIIGGETEAG